MKPNPAKMVEVTRFVKRGKHFVKVEESVDESTYCRRICEPQKGWFRGARIKSVSNQESSK